MNRAKHRITAFALALAVLLGGVIWQSPMTLQVQAATYADEMQEGTWNGYGRRYMEFGGILWRVLEVTTSDGTDGNQSGNKTALLFADDVLHDGSGNVQTMQFGGTNDWNGSDIKAWLNSEGTYAGGGFLDAAFTPQQQAAILTTTYIYGGTNYGWETTSSSQVFLLSVDEATDGEYFEDSSNIVDCAASGRWWLRSPGDSSSLAADVNSNGNVSPFGAGVISSIGIRPALKVNLASGIFTSSEILYSREITVQDMQGNGIAGANVSFVSLSGASAPVANFFTGSNGSGYSERIPAGEYELTVTKAGYPNYTATVTIGENSIKYAVTLSDASVPATVQFGSYSGSAVNWQVLDVAGGSALLLCEDGLNTGTWADMGAWINDSGAGGFLEAFSPWELAAMEDHNGTAGNTFLLSSQEAADYLPTNALRIFSHATSSERSWWLRDDDSGTPYIVNSIGEITIRNATVSLDARPAVWLDLSKLSQVADGGATTFVPAFAATISVEDGQSNPVDGIDLAITPTSGSGTIRGGDGSDILSGSTSGGGVADFHLPAGSYDIEVIGVPGYTGGGTIDIDTDGNLSGDLVITLEALAGVEDSTLLLMVGESADIDVSLGEGSTAATRANISSDKEAVATVSPVSLGQSGTVTVKGESVGQAVISIGYSGGNRDNEVDKVHVTVTDQPVTRVQVDFDPQGGEPTPNPMDVIVGGTYPTLPAVTRSGYIFDGWYTAASGGSRVVQGDTVTDSSDHTLYAQWSSGRSGNRSSSSGSGGGSSTPDSRVAKTTLPATAFSWDGRTLTIDHERITPLGLLSVRWDNVETTAYSVYSGSVIIRFDEDFIAGQAAGSHTVRVEFMNHTGETTVAVDGTTATPDAADNDTHNPNTGGDPDGGMSATDNPNTGDGRGMWPTLLLGCMSAAAAVIFGWRAHRREG